LGKLLKARYTQIRVINKTYRVQIKKELFNLLITVR
jgi:hypothetical protein